MGWSAIAWVEHVTVYGKQDRLEGAEKKEPAVPYGFPWCSEEAVITHRAEGEDPPRAHGHDAEANLAQEGCQGGFEGKNF